MPSPLDAGPEGTPSWIPINALELQLPQGGRALAANR